MYMCMHVCVGFIHYITVYYLTVNVYSCVFAYTYIHTYMHGDHPQSADADVFT